jgi:hypothetical protein
VEAQYLYDIYERGYSFPGWVLKKDLTRYLAFAVVYYDSTRTRDDALKLATEREPVHFSMSERDIHFDFKEGLRVGAYDHSENRMNIAIYLKSPFKVGERFYDVDVLNVVLPSLNDHDEPDFQRLYEDGPFTELQAYSKMLEPVFAKIKHCLEQYQTFKYVVFVGLPQDQSRFFGLFKYESRWRPRKVFDALLKKYIEPLNRNLLFLDEKENSLISEIISGKRRFNSVSAWKLEEVLFVSAWNPWSILGNGNGKDNTNEGYLGRISAMSVIGWPRTNPNIRFEAVDTPVANH